ncbi:MAG: GspE/PulE/PilB domain-containing protein [Planctomycetota bacterium]|jgi:hypothetical protein
MGWPFGKKKSRGDRVKKFSERMMAARESSDEEETPTRKSPPHVSDQHNIPDLSDNLELAEDLDLADIDRPTAPPTPAKGKADASKRSAEDILKQLEGGAPASAPIDSDAILDDDLMIDTPTVKTDSHDRLEDVDLGIDGLDDVDDLDLDVNITPKPSSGPKTRQSSRRVPDASSQELSGDQIRMGRLLLAEGPFTRDALRNELESSGRLTSPIAQVLLNAGAPDEKALLSFLLRNYRIPKVRLDGFRIPQNLRSVLPGDLLRKYRMIPIDLVGDILCVAVEDIYSFPAEAFEEIRKRTGYRAKVFSGDSANVTRLLGAVPAAAGEKLKPVKVGAGELKNLVPIGLFPGSSAASFRYNYCGAGTLKPVKR